MVPWEKDTWHESHVVWKVSPRTCVYVTHGKMNSRVRGSFLSLEASQTIRWEKKRKEKKRKNEIKGKRKEKKRIGNEEKEKKMKKRKV